MSWFSNTWKYFFGESCTRPTPNVDLESKPDLNTNLLSNNPITTDEPVIQRKVLFIDILDDEHKEEIKVEPILEQEEIKVEQQVEPILEQEEIKVEPILEQEEIKVEPILEQEVEQQAEPILEQEVEQQAEPIVEQEVEQQVEPIVEQEEIKEHHNDAPIVEQQVEQPIVESFLPKTAAECAILNQNLPENWRPFPMSNILQ